MSMGKTTRKKLFVDELRLGSFTTNTTNRRKT